MTNEARPRITKRLDRHWWRRVGTGYEQQDGYARLSRLKERSKTTGWGLSMAGAVIGSWPRLAQAKQRAEEMSMLDVVQAQSDVAAGRLAHVRAPDLNAYCREDVKSLCCAIDALAAVEEGVERRQRIAIRIEPRVIRSRLYPQRSTFGARLHEPINSDGACENDWHPEGGTCHRCCRVAGETRGHATVLDAIRAAVSLARRRGWEVRDDRVSRRATEG